MPFLFEKIETMKEVGVYSELPRFVIENCRRKKKKIRVFMPKTTKN